MGGGGNTGPVGTPGSNMMQPGPMPGYVPPAPAMPNMPVAAPNLGAPAAPAMPSLAAGAILPPAQRRQAATAAGNRMIAMGKALQTVGGAQPQQQQPRRGSPVSFNYQPAPYVPPPTPTGNGG